MPKSTTGPWALHMAWALSICAIALAAGPALAERKAFVVGNTKYAHTSSLANPANDARDLAAKLQALGYQVTLGLDVSRAQFLSSFQTFAQSLKQDDIALFYFAGHGLQIGGENYLFPVDARVEQEADARTRLVPLNALLADLSRSTRSRIVILDACRNNPFAEDLAKAQATRSAGLARGLARVYAGVGSFIAFSTQPGNVALDGAGRNSPFTQALLRHLAVSGADVHAVMRRVRADVQRETAEQQIPWENSSLVDEVSFAGSTAIAAAPDKPPAAPHGTQMTRPASQSYHFVTGLDPKGDNFLALRSTPAADGVRIATLGPDTLVKVLESRGVWRRVQLSDGTSGWAHGNWIACCRAIGYASGSGIAPTASPAATTAGETCESLWMRRNAIWHRYGYCFTSARGQQAFGNAGCSRDERAARAAFSPTDRDQVDSLAAREKMLGCR